MASPDTARATVAKWREQIAAAVECAATGPLRQVLERNDVGHCYLVKVLDVHPCLGKVRGRRLMAELGLQRETRLGELSAQAREDLAGRCGCVVD